MTEEDYARYIRELENINAILRLVADGQRPLHECFVRIAASRERMRGRAAQHGHEYEARDAKRHAMTAGSGALNDELRTFSTGTDADSRASSTSAKVAFEIEVPAGLARLRLPAGVDRRLQALLHKQDGGTPLGPDERAEAEGLVELTDLLTLLRLRTSELHSSSRSQVNRSMFG